MAKKVATWIDLHVAQRVRLRRIALDVSQQQLGDALGVTFQQIRKYEKGTNRITAGRLFELSKALDVAVSFFYEGLTLSRPTVTGFSEAEQEPYVGQDASAAESRQLNASFQRIKDPAGRRLVLDLTRWMSAVDDSAQSGCP